METKNETGFNRTFMELKQGESSSSEREPAVLIGPSWN